jgi:dipeptidyl aminopeptidase/acylaminoacyl peptidase
MSTVLSLDDVLNVQKPHVRCPFTISSDAKWLAFTVTGHGTDQSNIGVSDEAEGNTQWVCHIDSGKAFPIVPQASSSWSGTWSPDGKRLAFYSDLEGKAQLWVWNAEDQSLCVASDVVVRPFFGFEKPIWTSDGHSIIVKATTPGYENNSSFNPKIVHSAKVNEDSVKVYSTVNDNERTQAEDNQSSFIERYRSDIVRIDWKTNKEVIIASNHHPVGISLSEDGQKIAFTSCKGLERIDHQQVIYDLWVAPVYPDLERKKNAYCLQKNVRMDYGRSFTWGIDNETIYYTTAGPLADGGLWSIHSDQIEESKPLFHEQQLTLQRPFRLKNGDLLCTGNGKLWRYIQKSSEIIDLSSKLDKHVVDFVPTIMNTNEPVEKQFVLVQTRDRHKQQQGLVLLNVNSGEVKQLLEENRTHIQVCLSSNNDIRIAAYIEESTSETPHLCLCNVETNQKKKIADITSFPTDCIGTTKLLKWQRDEKDVHGVLLLPGVREGKVPVILDVYAGEKVTGLLQTFGLHGASVDNRHLFSSRGYAVFIPELPINSNEPADEIEKGLVAALEELSKCPEVDMNRLGIMGHSFGGYTTLVAITKLNKTFKAAVSSAGIGDLISQTTHFDPKFHLFNYDWAENGQCNMGVSIWENKERYIRNSPLFDFDKIETPVLIVQGTKDPHCAAQAGPMFSALRRLNKTAELALYDEDHWHGTWKYENIKDSYDRVFRWFSNYL